MPSNRHISTINAFSGTTESSRRLKSLTESNILQTAFKMLVTLDPISVISGLDSEICIIVRHYKECSTLYTFATHSATINIVDKTCCWQTSCRSKSHKLTFQKNKSLLMCPRNGTPHSWVRRKNFRYF